MELRKRVWADWRIVVYPCVVLVLAGWPLGAAGQVVRYEFSNDHDVEFEPDTRNPAAEPFAGAGQPPDDWHDERIGWACLSMEENSNTLGDDPSYPGPDPGALTPEYAVMQRRGTNGTVWFPGVVFAQASAFTFGVAHYADPVIVPNGNGTADFEWGNIVSGSSGAALAGIGAEAVSGGWLYLTDAGTPIATVPSGAWYVMEMTIFQGADGDFDATHSLWDATHANLLGSVTATTLTVNVANQPIEPGESHFWEIESNIDVLFLDAFTVVPEPMAGGLALIALSCWMPRRTRRR